MRHILPCEEFAGAYLDMCREYKAFGEDFYSTIDSLDKAFARIQREKEFAQGIVPDGKVLNIAYWFIDDRGERVVGTGRLRPALNERFNQLGGHIGYDVRPAERRKGLGTRILADMLSEARAAGLDRVLITCDETNLGSIGVIENNGGLLENSRVDGEGLWHRRYWIDLGLARAGAGT
jgi:predicted acetyltransferase